MSEAKRLRELEQENTRLKKLLAESMLEHVLYSRLQKFSEFVRVWM